MRAQQILVELQTRQNNTEGKIGEQLYIHDPVKLLRDLASSIDIDEIRISENRHDETNRAECSIRLATPST